MRTLRLVQPSKRSAEEEERRTPILIKRLPDLDGVNSIFNSPLPAELSSERPDVRDFALISETPR